MHELSREFADTNATLVGTIDVPQDFHLYYAYTPGRTTGLYRQVLSLKRWLGWRRLGCLQANSILSNLENFQISIENFNNCKTPGSAPSGILNYRFYTYVYCYPYIATLISTEKIMKSDGRQAIWVECWVNTRGVPANIAPAPAPAPAMPPAANNFSICTWVSAKRRQHVLQDCFLNFFLIFQICLSPFRLKFSGELNWLVSWLIFINPPHNIFF